MASPALTSARDFVAFSGTMNITSRGTKQKATPESDGIADTYTINLLPENTDGSHLPRFTKPVLPQERYSLFTKESFQVLQKWEGVVLEIDEEDREFRAELFDKTNPFRPVEEATFDMDEISVSDLDLLRLGALFYWSIGYLTDKGGTKSKLSSIRFSRLRGFPDSAVSDAKNKATLLLEQLRGSNT